MISRDGAAGSIRERRPAGRPGAGTTSTFGGDASFFPAMLKSMVRCAGSSIAAVSLEFAILSLLVSALHLFYLAGALIAGAVGFFVSFLLNRRWAFRARHGSAPRQLIRHSVVVGGGIALGMLFMWLLISRLHLPYQVGWLGGGAMVFLVWTFPMQRFFTFGASIPDAAAA